MRLMAVLLFADPMKSLFNKVLWQKMKYFLYLCTVNYKNE